MNPEGRMRNANGKTFIVRNVCALGISRTGFHPPESSCSASDYFLFKTFNARFGSRTRSTSRPVFAVGLVATYA